MQLREAIQSDLEAVADHSISRGCFREMPDRIDYVYTLEHEGRVLAVGGMKLLTQTSAWCWMDLTPAALAHIILVYRVIREWLDIFVSEHGLHRLMAAVHVDFDAAIRTVEHLGFQRESLMKQFYGDKDVWLYARLVK